jgi:RNA polymerase sigma-70 factor (ECF subfamily)
VRELEIAAVIGTAFSGPLTFASRFDRAGHVNGLHADQRRRMLRVVITPLLHDRAVPMTDSQSQQSMVQQFLPQAVAGDQAALDALLRHNCDRLTSLTRRMLGDFRRVRRWTETADVLQNALLRLVAALRDSKPQNSREFLALATLQIRRELLDLARKYYGPHGMGANQDSAAAAGPDVPTPADKGDLSHEPCSLAQWTELHQQIDALPEEEREVVGLLFYQGISQAEAAEVLNVSMRTVQRRWHAALYKLHGVWSAAGDA